MAVAKKTFEKAQADYNSLKQKRSAPIYEGVKQYFTSPPTQPVEPSLNQKAQVAEATNQVPPETKTIQPANPPDIPLNQLSLDERIDRQIAIDNNNLSLESPMSEGEESLLLENK